MVTNNLATEADWEISSKLLSDHNGVKTTIRASRQPAPSNHLIKWVTKDANWTLFSEFIDEHFSKPQTSSQDDKKLNIETYPAGVLAVTTIPAGVLVETTKPAGVLVETTNLALKQPQNSPSRTTSLEDSFGILDAALNYAASRALRQVPKHKRKTVRPLWQLDPAYKTSKSLVNRLLRAIKSTRHPDTLADLRVAQTACRKAAQKSKNAAWLEWCSELNAHSSLTDMWKQLKRIAGTSTPAALSPGRSRAPDRAVHSMLKHLKPSCRSPDRPSSPCPKKRRRCQAMFSRTSRH
jgi:hypothetical protein